MKKLLLISFFCLFFQSLVSQRANVEYAYTCDEFLENFIMYVKGRVQNPLLLEESFYLEQMAIVARDFDHEVSMNRRRCEKNKGYQQKVKVISSNIVEYLDYLRDGNDPGKFYRQNNIFSIEKPKADISNLWFNLEEFNTPINITKYLYEDNINVRVAPTTESPKLTGLPIGTEVTVLELTRENYSIQGINYPWLKISFWNNEVLQEGYIVAKFLAETGIKEKNDNLFLLSPLYNYEQQYQIKTIKCNYNRGGIVNKEISKLNLTSKQAYDYSGGISGASSEWIDFKAIDHNIGGVFFFNISFCGGGCARSCYDEYLFWNGKKFYNATSDENINLSYGWEFDEGNTKLLVVSRFYFNGGHKYKVYPDDWEFDIDEGEIYERIIKEFSWTGEKLQQTNYNIKLIQELQEKENKWHYKGDLFSGIIIEKGKNGQLKSEKKIKNGIQEGDEFEYFGKEAGDESDPKISCITSWKNGKWNGPKIWYNENGEIEKEVEYLDWKLVEKKQVVELDVEIEPEFKFEGVDTEDEEKIEFEAEEEVDEIVDFAVVEGSPIFPGCKVSIKSTLSQRKEEDRECLNKGIMKHIVRNFEYPKMAKEMGIQEKIFVRFVIDKTGEITNVQVLRGEDPYLKTEAIRLVKSLPKMRPANQRGKPIGVNYTIPINFMLN